MLDGGFLISCAETIRVFKANEMRTRNSQLATENSQLETRE